MTKPQIVPLPDDFSGFRNCHKGETIVVCGCGESLNKLVDPGRFITIGVNDVGRLFDPTYLVVLNPKQQFRGDRFSYVESSRARAVFSQLPLNIQHPKLIRFKLGRQGGTAITSQDVLPYTRNSPYVAVCLAAYMGASRIGLIGVDLTDNHFFAKTGRHALSRQREQIDREYADLSAAFNRQGISLVNLSSTSLLHSMNFMSLDEFFNQPQSTSAAVRDITPASVNRRKQRTTKMKLAIERRQPGIVGDFFDTLARTATRLGHEVSRHPVRNNTSRDVVSVVWNGRYFNSSGPILYCEHGWLPRWDYQISWKGINAGSHIAPFIWDGKALDEECRQSLQLHLEKIRRGGPKKYNYMQTDVAPARGMPDEFLLVPLQMERDTNIIRHAPPRYRRMQAFIDDIARSNPPFTVIFKQHPADVRNGNSQLRLRLQRKQDLLWAHSKGNIHQLLKSGHCRGIISLNSNVVHDGLVWDIPSIVLGSNIWPREGVGPFLTQLPNSWSGVFGSTMSEQQLNCREAYAYYLMKNQWSMQDLQSTEKVAELLKVMTTERNAPDYSRVLIMPRRSRPLINVVARNRGWLFEDLKAHFAKFNSPSLSISSSERALPGADAWIYLRTAEAAFSPDLSRTVVQIHDLFDDGVYGTGGERQSVARCGAIVLTLPGQRKLLLDNHINLDSRPVLEKPPGAPSSFELKQHMSDKFSLAWVGRPCLHERRDLKRADWFVQAVKQLELPVRVSLIGERLEKQFNALRKAGCDCLYLSRARYSYQQYPQLYSQLDCLVVTAESGTKQNSLFEALATGVPVIATPTAWVKEYIRHNENGFIVNSVDEITDAITKIYSDRQGWFERRHAIRKSVENCSLESWIKENIDLSLKLINRKKEQIAASNNVSVSVNR